MTYHNIKKLPNFFVGNARSSILWNLDRDSLEGLEIYSIASEVEHN